MYSDCYQQLILSSYNCFSIFDILYYLLQSKWGKNPTIMIQILQQIIYFKTSIEE